MPTCFHYSDEPCYCSEDETREPRCTRCGEVLSPDSAVIHEHGVLCDDCSYKTGVPVVVDEEETTPLLRLMRTKGVCSDDASRS